MSDVLSLRREHDFGITGDLDRPWRVRAIGQSDSAEFDIVLRRDADLRVRLNLLVYATKFRSGLREDGLIAFRRLGGWLPGIRPDGATVRVTQITKAAVAVAGRVLAPSRDGQIAPSAVT